VIETVHQTELRRTPFGMLLNVVGLLVVIGYLIPQIVGGSVSPQWTTPFAVASVLAWIANVLTPVGWRRVSWGLYFVMVAAGATAAWSTNGLLIIPLISAIVQIAAAANPPWLTYLYSLIGAGIVLVVPLTVAIGGGKGVTVEGILSLEFGVVVALLGGINRRQARARQAAAAELVERTAVMREEQAKASALAARQALARDMHDVLAHSLGGLVIQLDAVEAQLEAGKTDAALKRLHDARSMAASGLAEARRAVEALRSQTDATASVASADLAAQLIDLVDAHERLDGRIDFEQLGTPVDVTQSVATALRRALQESLSNARKHAPGEPVRVRISWHPQLVTLEVSNPVGADASTAHSSGRGGVQLATTGSGRGLGGMRERFAELPGGRVESGVEDGRFAVRAQAELVDAEGAG
jgi:signal transduction histidine kinase